MALATRRTKSTTTKASASTKASTTNMIPVSSIQSLINSASKRRYSDAKSEREFFKTKLRGLVEDTQSV